MKKLESYHKNKLDWQLIKRQGDIAIFSASESYGTFYEVIKIQSHNGREIGGNKLPPAEYAPSNSEWGQKGWSFSNFTDAENKFRQLVTELPISATPCHRHDVFATQEGGDS